MERRPGAAQLAQLLVQVRSSLWFVPTLIIFAAVLLAAGLVELDRRLGESLQRWLPRLFATEADGARGMLTAIATSMATVAGVVFSITIVALALASTQYTPRVLRNFMRDRANQVVLGVFVGVYIYCLLVLRTISGAGSFVPSAAVLMAVVLAVVAIGFLIFFIHHISASIQASEIIAAITGETVQAIDRLFPEDMGDEPEADAEALDDQALPGAVWQPVPALEMGYLQRVDREALLAFARRHGCIVRMECAVGDFVAPGWPLVSLRSPAVSNRATAREAKRIFGIASFRTIDQDAAFGIRQLVDIALKALSPGVNDTTTAVICIEHLTFLLARCAGRRIVSPLREEQGGPRVITRGSTFEQLVALSFRQILENAEGNSEIMLRVLVAIERIVPARCSASRVEGLFAWVEEVGQMTRRSVSSAHVAHLLDVQLEKTRRALREALSARR